MTFGDAAYYRRMWLLARERATRAEENAAWLRELGTKVVKDSIADTAQRAVEHSCEATETLELYKRRNAVQRRTIEEVQEALNLPVGFNCEELAPRIRDLKKQLAVSEGRLSDRCWCKRQEERLNRG